ncbi:MAG TPA: NAD kinase [Lutibacter sp.]|nr:NAD kinase [Lutibacter sp.]
MKIAVFGQAYKTESLNYILNLLDFLNTKVCDIFLVQDVSDLIKDKTTVRFQTFKPKEALTQKIDYLISVGGDGTILRAAAIIKDSNIPIIGINTGRLGFLATINKEDMLVAIDELLKGNYRISKRSLLEVNTKNNELEKGYALNEISVSGKNTMSMININTYLNDKYLNTYWADGLIIATPTGSTGYSLSCNGPIITPEVQALSITPIAPHNLSIRPLIIKDDTLIKLKIESREKEFLLSMDARVATLQTKAEVNIKKANFQLQMVELNNQSFIKTLREKLLWGNDTRN